MTEPPIPSSSNSLPRGWTSRAKRSQNPELILNTWAPELISAVTFFQSTITEALLDHATRWATGTGFGNGIAWTVSLVPVCLAAFMPAGLCLGLWWECAGQGLLLAGASFASRRMSCIPTVSPWLVWSWCKGRAFPCHVAPPLAP